MIGESPQRHGSIEKAPHPPGVAVAGGCSEQRAREEDAGAESQWSWSWSSTDVD